MRPIDKFILHVVHNLFPLNEYSEGAIRQIMQQYRDEAEDLNIKITDEQLKKYIERFDVIKAGLISKGKTTDIVKQGAGGKLEVILPLSKLIKLVTSSKGGDIEDEKEDDTPDVVYNENNKTIWNGSKEGNCITYGSGEKWCITRGSYGGYRYSASRGYPTFYLAKNNDLPDSDPLSFVAIQVRDPKKVNDSEKYVYTNRKNNPYESKPMSFSRLTSEIPWLKDIPNIESILKYIPLTSKEKITQQYSNNAISVREWMKLPFETKKQYLVVRKRSELFDDIDTKTFIKNYLPEYPQIAEFIAVTPGIIDPIALLANLESFKPQDRKSITANLQSNVNTQYLSKETLPFSIKKLLVTLDKWDIKSNERMYVTKDGNAIVKLNFTDDGVSIGLYTEDDDYPNVKLNQRTSKYLLDYPELDKIPFNTMLKLVSKDVISKELLDKVIDNAKKDPNSAIIVKTLEDGTDVLVDSNSFVSYKIKDDKITKVPFTDEDVQKVFADAKDNEGFQQNSLNILQDAVSEGDNLPTMLDKEAFVSIINSIPYNKRKITYNNNNFYVIAPENSEHTFILKSNDSSRGGYGKISLDAFIVGDEGNWREVNRYGRSLNKEDWKAYFDFLRNQNIVYNDNELINTLKSSGYGGSINSKKGFIEAAPPVDQNNRYVPVVANLGGPMQTTVHLLLNKTNPRESFKISDNSGKLVKANVSSGLAARLLGTTAAPGAPAAAAAPATARRRGRPAGGGQPRAAAPAAPAAAGDINVPERMQETGLETAFMRLPRADYRRLAVANATRINPNGDRGAARRNNQLGNRGRVGQVIQVGASKIYIIRLANQQIIASINVQPGNRNYVLFGNENGNVALPLNSPAELVNALQQRGLAEMRRYLTQEYLANNPEQLEEVRGLLQQYVAETKNN
jgi:hypothetical protein